MTLIVTPESALMQGKQKPKQYGPLSYVQAVVRHNAERMGIDPASLVSYWPFWEKGGLTAHDYSLYKNDGTLNGSPIWQNDGIYFDGTNDYIKIPTNASLEKPAINNEFSLFLIGNFLMKGGYCVSKYDTTNDERSWGFYAADDPELDDNYRCYTSSDGSYQNYAESTVLITSYIDNSLFCKFDNGSTKLIENGILIMDESRNSTLYNNDTTDVLIGARSDGNGTFGELKFELRFCLLLDRALPDEYGALFYSHPYALLVRPWTTPPIFFDEGGGTTLTLSDLTSASFLGSITPTAIRMVSLADIQSATNVSNLSISLVTVRTYSRGDYAALPGDDTALETEFNEAAYTNIEDDDNVYVTQSASDEYPIFLWKDRNTNSTDAITVSCTLKSNCATTEQTAYLQIYNRTTGSWETLDSDSVTARDTEFTLSGTQSTDLSDYYDGDNWISCRVYQAKA